jgi:hypothetical protein
MFKDSMGPWIINVRIKVDRWGRAQLKIVICDAPGMDGILIRSPGSRQVAMMTEFGRIPWTYETTESISQLKKKHLTFEL